MPKKASITPLWENQLPILPPNLSSINEVIFNNGWAFVSIVPKSQQFQKENFDTTSGQEIMVGTQLQPRNYTVVEPCCNWSREKECDTLVVNVSGFKKDQLRVLINTRRKLNISGERHIDGNHWSRLNKEFQVSKNMNIRGVHATFDKDQELLCVVLPKFASQINKPQEGEATQVGKNPPLIGSKTVAKKDSSRGGQALASKASHGINLEGRGGNAVPVIVVEKDMRDGGEEDFPRRSEVYVDRVVGKRTTSEGSGGLFISMYLRKIRAWAVLVVVPILLLIIGLGASVLL